MAVGHLHDVHRREEASQSTAMDCSALPSNRWVRKIRTEQSTAVATGHVQSYDGSYDRRPPWIARCDNCRTGRSRAVGRHDRRAPVSWRHVAAPAGSPRLQNRGGWAPIPAPCPAGWQTVIESSLRVHFSQRGDLLRGNLVTPQQVPSLGEVEGTSFLVRTPTMIQSVQQAARMTTTSSHPTAVRARRSISRLPWLELVFKSLP